MDILVFGGTRFFGLEIVKHLLDDNHHVTIANRGKTPDPFGDKVSRLIIDRHDVVSLQRVLRGSCFNAVIDNFAYSSNDVRRILELVNCDWYILTSTCGVYSSYDTKITEEAFDPFCHELIWGDRDWSKYGFPGEFDYDEGKRQAEAALVQKFSEVKSAIIRFPVIMGKNDYTGRLRFYIDHVLSGKPMYVSNMDVKISFFNSTEAGGAFASVVKSGLSGPVNCASDGVVSVGQIIDYVEKKTGRTAVISNSGDPAPYNCFSQDYRLCTDKAKSHGMVFSHINDWIWDLIDWYIDSI